MAFRKNGMDLKHGPVRKIFDKPPENYPVGISGGEEILRAGPDWNQALEDSTVEEGFQGLKGFSGMKVQHAAQIAKTDETGRWGKESIKQVRFGR